jgi:hypothetical protein
MNEILIIQYPCDSARRRPPEHWASRGAELGRFLVNNFEKEGRDENR